MAAAIPAMRATASTSPLGTVPARSASTIAGEQRTMAAALAERAVDAFSVTSTMYAAPEESRWVRRMGSVLITGSLVTCGRGRAGG